MERIKELYKGVDDECNIYINIFGDGLSYVLDTFARSGGMYQYVNLSDGGELLTPEKVGWW